MKMSNRQKTFLILLMLSVSLAALNRYGRMILVTFPLWQFHLETLAVYVPAEEIAAIKKSILWGATFRVILIDTLFNLAALYIAPNILRIFTKQFAIEASLKFHKWVKGDYR
tara:strand:- start:2692 stop:3027 length:336 start_codon:yes stop_codon:yes gene_type:complete